MRSGPFVGFMLTTLLSLFGCSSSTINIVHYNIKELSTPTLEDPDSSQLKAVKKVLAKLPFNKENIDILSINEIQFDRQGIPSEKYQSNGENLSKLQKRLGLKFQTQIFHPANTGEGAKKQPDGTYAMEWSKKSLAAADKVNFGLFPHQYSTGALTNFPLVSQQVIKELPWKTFNPELDLAKFQTKDGKPFPEDMPLFDKNFVDAVVKIEGKPVHLIFLHAVPSFPFGNPHSPNKARNRDQLRFLEWYLTGETDIPVKLPHHKPLSEEDRFIAMGDWNANFHDGDAGTKVLKRLLGKTQSFISPQEIERKKLSSNITEKGEHLMLDYIVTSPHFAIKKSGILNKRPKISEQASDHLPIWTMLTL